MDGGVGPAAAAPFARVAATVMGEKERQREREKVKEVALRKSQRRAMPTKHYSGHGTETGGVGNTTKAPPPRTHDQSR